MKRQDWMLRIVIGAALFISGVVSAQVAQNVDPRRHPNLAAAQRFCEQAFDKLSAAQRANEFDMSGHAARAKDLLEQAGQEIKAAAVAANHR